MDLIEIIEAGLKRKNLSARQASMLVTGNDGVIKNIRAGHPPSFKNIEKLFEVLGINMTYSFDDDIPTPTLKAPMLGYVAAGGDELPDDTSVTFFPDNDNYDKVSAPPHTYLQMRNNLFGLTVKGSSMLPVYADGDLLFAYKDDPVRGDHDRIVGLNCAITLESGEIYVKRLARPDSGIRGEWNLESLNPRWPVMRNQRLIEALPIRHVTHKV